MKNRAPVFQTAVWFFVFAGLLFTMPACSRKSAGTPGPPNEPAKIGFRDGKLRIDYAGQTIFKGEVVVEGKKENVRSLVNVFRPGDRVSQVVLLTSGNEGLKLRIFGTVFGSVESFPVEADRRAKGPLIVRHSSGTSRNLLNRAVYDRRGDWVLSVDANPPVIVSPSEEKEGGRTFNLRAEGGEIVLRFRPRFYQKHRGLPFFDPWTYKTWPGSIAGWVSWFAFFDKVTEKDIIETADVLSEVLLPFGCEYLQIDDGYQKGQGRPELWLNANDKFPRGLGFLAGYIKSKGLKPGLWTNAAFNQADFAEAHKAWFLTDGRGSLHKGNWIGLSLDGSVAAALDAVVKPIYRGLHDQGWEYYKVDALRHLRYEGYNAGAEHFARNKRDLVTAYRDYVRTIREEIDRDHFMLGCWGIRPELTGLIDGCRIGNDGFSYAGLAQYNSFNNVVWRNDPDHIELNADAYKSLTVTSLTGSLLLLTDKPAVYKTEAVEPAKRAVPVLWTLPGQIFDVDPSRSAELWRVDSEVSGSGPRAFDAGTSTTCDLFLLEVNRPFENWAVLGRTGESAAEVRFADLGLDPAKEYFVFEFWTKKLLGSFTGAFIPGPIDPKFRCQDFAVRERLDRPQIVATNRHVSCGGVDLLDASWEKSVLTGRSRVVGGDVYEIYLALPDGFRLDKFTCDGADILGIERTGVLVKLTLMSRESREIGWSVRFSN